MSDAVLVPALAMGGLPDAIMLVVKILRLSPAPFCAVWCICGVVYVRRTVGAV